MLLLSTILQLWLNFPTFHPHTSKAVKANPRVPQEAGLPHISQAISDTQVKSNIKGTAFPVILTTSQYKSSAPHAPIQ
jgi:hypothetical protein